MSGLTAEQIAIRATGIGASEIAAIVGIDPWQSPIDVWLRKRGIVALGTDEESEAAEVGSLLEPSLVDLFRARTGLSQVTRPVKTYCHPEHAWVLASPDALLGDPEHPDALAEFKVVGFNMRSDWEDGVPLKVVAQVQWQMMVMRVTLCHVARLIGTDFQVIGVRADAEAQQLLFEAGQEFWRSVQDGTPPPPSAMEDRREYLKKRFRGTTRDILPVPPDHAGFVEDLRRQYLEAKSDCAEAQTALEHVECELKELIGDAGGIRLPSGDAFTWQRDQVGRADYKSIAADLAPFGKIPDELIEKHRGTPSRRFLFSPAKNRTVRRSK